MPWPTDAHRLGLCLSERWGGVDWLGCSDRPGGRYDASVPLPKGFA
jgi:hypothetical protein